MIDQNTYFFFLDLFLFPFSALLLPIPNKSPAPLHFSLSVQCYLHVPDIDVIELKFRPDYSHFPNYFSNDTSNRIADKWLP